MGKKIKKKLQKFIRDTIAEVLREMYPPIVPMQPGTPQNPHKNTVVMYGVQELGSGQPPVTWNVKSTSTTGLKPEE
jgi:hypothetical protein